MEKLIVGTKFRRFCE